MLLQKRMKVAVIVPIVGNFGRKGFYHSQEIGLGKSVASHGNEVTVYKCVPLNSADRMETERFGKLTIRYIPTKAYGPHGMLNVNLIDENSDVAFVFSDTQLIIPKLYRFCKRNRITFIPYVGIAHSFQQNFKSMLMDRVFRETTLKVYKNVRVIAKTIDAKEELVKLGVRDCLVAPVGLDSEALKQDYEKYDRNEIRKKWGFQENDLIISFVARMQPEKHPLEMLDIFTKIRHKNKKLLMVGRGLLENKLYDKVQKLGIGDQIVYNLELLRNENIRFDENLKRAEDVKFNDDFICKSGTFFLLNKCLYVYNCCNLESVSRKQYKIIRTSGDAYREIELLENSYGETRDKYKLCGVTENTFYFLKVNIYRKYIYLLDKYGDLIPADEIQKRDIYKEVVSDISSLKRLEIKEKYRLEKMVGAVRRKMKNILKTKRISRQSQEGNK